MHNKEYYETHIKRIVNERLDEFERNINNQLELLRFEIRNNINKDR